jgi:DNA-binding LacI/PurR family transcriptional regulator
MINHMVAQGYRRIGAMFGPGYYPYIKERYNGYVRALEAHGLTWSAVSYSEYDSTTIRRNLNSLLESHPEMDALYLASGGDFLFDVFKVLKERKIRVPDFGLGVFDDYPFMELITPRITAVRQPLFIAGQQAVALLQNLIQDTPPEQRMVQLSTELIVRDSCRELTPEK